MGAIWATFFEDPRFVDFSTPSMRNLVFEVSGESILVFFGGIFHHFFEVGSGIDFSSILGPFGSHFGSILTSFSSLFGIRFRIDF